MSSVTPSLLSVGRELLVIPSNMSRVVASFSCDDCCVVGSNEEKVVFGMKEIASVFLELSREEEVAPITEVNVLAIIMVEIVFSDEKSSSVGEETGAVEFLNGTSTTSELVKVEETIVPCEVGPTYGTGVISNVDAWVVSVVLGGGEDNEVKNALSLVEVLEETTVVEKLELLTGIEEFSDLSPEVPIETLFK